MPRLNRRPIIASRFFTLYNSTAVLYNTVVHLIFPLFSSAYVCLPMLKFLRGQLDARLVPKMRGGRQQCATCLSLSFAC